MKVYLIAAVAQNGVIGHAGELPWHLPEDLKRFKAVTTGHAVVMGRKTWESIGKPLPNRRNIVLTRNASYPLPAGVERFSDLDKALAACRAAGNEKAFVIGGSDVYRTALPVADGLFITHVDRDVDGDAHFPDWNPADWRKVSDEPGNGVRFAEYVRKKA